MKEPPPPVPVEPAELPRLARECLARAKFPLLATVEGDQPRVRPISPLRVEGFTVYFANLRSYGKTAQLAANPRVELCWLDDRHDQVRIEARVEIVTDRAVLEALWAESPLLRRYLGSLENPALVIYRCVPVSVRFMREWALDYWPVPLDA
jgi:uncharacterized pyridoxamine 5'-phosphate oxidase family protein